MDINMIDRIFDLKNKNIVTPYNLLENLKNNNYMYANYSKKNNLILCNIGFIDNGNLINFLYKFNKDFKLENISYEIENGERVELFNRQKELDIALFKYDQYNKNSKAV